MKNVFRYGACRRWLSLLISPLFVVCGHGLTLVAIQSNDIFLNVLCFLGAGIFICLSFKILNHALIKVITNENGITVTKLFSSISIKWDEIIEYGRYRRVLFKGKAWCFYVKSIFFLDKNIVVGLEYLGNFNELNNMIIKNAKGAKFKNTRMM